MNWTGERNGLSNLEIVFVKKIKINFRKAIIAPIFSLNVHFT